MYKKTRETQWWHLLFERKKSDHMLPSDFKSFSTLCVDSTYIYINDLKVFPERVKGSHPPPLEFNLINFCRYCLHI